VAANPSVWANSFYLRCQVRGPYPTPMRNAVLRATSVLTSGCEKNAEISVLKRRVHPPGKRNSKTGFGRGWENVGGAEMAKSELAARFRDISACC